MNLDEFKFYYYEWLQTALMLASEKGHQAVVDTLLAHGADVNLKGVRTVVGR